LHDFVSYAENYKYGWGKYLFDNFPSSGSTQYWKLHVSHTGELTWWPPFNNYKYAIIKKSKAIGSQMVVRCQPYALAALYSPEKLFFCF
jgi:hypothetical protein